MINPDSDVVPVTIGKLGGPVVGLAKLSQDADGVVTADIRLLPDVPVAAHLRADMIASISIELPDGH